MRVIPKPHIAPIRAYIYCYSSFDSIVKQNQFKSISRFLNIKFIQYDIDAISTNLYTYPTHTNVHGSISKSDMKILYNQNMVKNKRGKKVYDKLMSLAPLSRCPFCGIGSVSTLDHYLPKAEFPTFSVLPYNLVASCKDCNTGKLASYARTQGAQTLHPYYDNYTSEQWLFARVIHSSPASIEFYVNAPTYWNQVDKDRVQSHFDNYKLSKRFSIEASNELSDLREEFILHNSTPIIIQQELQKKTRTYISRYKNSWETAMFQALSQSQWYWYGGYR